MLHVTWLDSLRLFTVEAVILRLTLAVVFGGIVGWERERRGHPAGFRTHMLVCLGSALAVLASLYVREFFGEGDTMRIAAQVVSGIGFLGAGTIIVTGQFQRQIRGLTTAAGLWTSACMGIAIGFGFYEGALITFALILMIMALLYGLGMHIHHDERELSLYVEFVELGNISAFIRALHLHGCAVASAETSRRSVGGDGTAMFITVKFPAKDISAESLMSRLQSVGGVVFLERVS
jgi:putative Mg2+ transporter-C (MgtC) family protein